MGSKKPLILVSICAVILLVLGSLSNVVGYQSVKSTTVNDSPLFNVRTQRATNQQQNTYTFQYLGKGKENLLQFSIMDDKTEKLKKALEIISEMDDETFEQFKELCIQKIKQDNTFSDVNPNEISQVFHQFRTKQKTINYFIYRNNFAETISHEPTCYGGRTLCNWFPGCIISQIIAFIYNIVGFILVFISLFIPTASNPSCNICPLLHQ